MNFITVEETHKFGFQTPLINYGNEHLDQYTRNWGRREGNLSVRISHATRTIFWIALKTTLSIPCSMIDITLGVIQSYIAYKNGVPFRDSIGFCIDKTFKSTLRTASAIISAVTTAGAPFILLKLNQLGNQASAKYNLLNATSDKIVLFKGVMNYIAGPLKITGVFITTTLILAGLSLYTSQSYNGQPSLRVKIWISFLAGILSSVFMTKYFKTPISISDRELFWRGLSVLVFKNNYTSIKLAVVITILFCLIIGALVAFYKTYLDILRNEPKPDVTHNTQKDLSALRHVLGDVITEEDLQTIESFQRVPQSETLISHKLLEKCIKLHLKIGTFNTYFETEQICKPTTFFEKICSLNWLGYSKNIRLNTTDFTPVLNSVWERSQNSVISKITALYAKDSDRPTNSDALFKDRVRSEITALYAQINEIALKLTISPKTHPLTHYDKFKRMVLLGCYPLEKMLEVGLQIDFAEYRTSTFHPEAKDFEDLIYAIYNWSESHFCVHPSSASYTSSSTGSYRKTTQPRFND